MNVIQSSRLNTGHNQDDCDTIETEIDQLVYALYGLNDDDIKEVETWYARRYPKLARFAEVE